MAATRSNGIRKTIIGIGLICVPIVAFFIFMAIGYLPIKIFAVTIMVGLYGGLDGPERHPVDRGSKNGQGGRR